MSGPTERALVRAHVSTLLDFARQLQPALHRLPMSQETFKAQGAAAVLERALEDLLGVLR